MRFQVLEMQEGGFAVVDTEDDNLVSSTLTDRVVAETIAELHELIAELRGQFETLSTTVVHIQNGTPVHLR